MLCLTSFDAMDVFDYILDEESNQMASWIKLGYGIWNTNKDQCRHDKRCFVRTKYNQLTN